MIKYTIYTEDKNKKSIEKILNDSPILKGYTLTETTGSWRGLTEHGLKIEILLVKKYIYTIKSICKAIKRLNKQEAVLFTAQEVESYFV